MSAFNVRDDAVLKAINNLSITGGGNGGDINIDLSDTNTILSTINKNVSEISIPKLDLSSTNNILTNIKNSLSDISIPDLDLSSTNDILTNIKKSISNIVIPELDVSSVNSNLKVIDNTLSTLNNNIVNLKNLTSNLVNTTFINGAFIVKMDLNVNYLFRMITDYSYDSLVIANKRKEDSSFFIDFFHAYDHFFFTIPYPSSDLVLSRNYNYVKTYKSGSSKTLFRFFLMPASISALHIPLQKAFLFFPDTIEFGHLTVNYTAESGRSQTSCDVAIRRFASESNTRVIGVYGMYFYDVDFLNGYKFRIDPVKDEFKLVLGIFYRPRYIIADIEQMAVDWETFMVTPYGGQSVSLLKLLDKRWRPKDRGDNIMCTNTYYHDTTDLLSQNKSFVYPA